MIGELTNHVWQSTVFAAAAGLLTAALRKNRAKVRYWLWFIASVKFLVPFALAMSLGSHLAWAPAARAMATPAVSLTVVQIAQPFPEASPLAPTAPRHGDWVPMAMLGVWACGFAGIAAMRLRGWRRIRGAVRSSVAIDIPATVEVRSAPGLLEPGVVGWLRPVLLLPAGIAERLTAAQLEAVLAHELCHVRRRDNLFASIHMVVEAMFWFHPLVWWIGARLVEERERACDEEVLRLGSEAEVYAEGIVNVCKLYLESPLACVSGVTGADIQKRIEAIMTNSMALKLNFAKKVALAVAGMAALAAPVVIGMMHAPAMRAQSQAPVIHAPAVTPPSQPVSAVSAAPIPAGRLMVPPILAQSVAAATAGDEHDRRVAYAKEKFGSAIFGMGRTYVEFGPPDQIEDHSADSSIPWQIWRYNYLADFHSNVEFQFSTAESVQQMRIDFPPPEATYEGEPVVDASLAQVVEALGRGSQSQGEAVSPTRIAGLPGRHASMQIYPVKWYRVLMVPFDSLTGQVRVTAEIIARANLRIAASMVDLMPASQGAAQATFGLEAGSYVCNVAVREMETGRTFFERIDFEAK
jgi:beta-lactamase regulating signal transducer with metallopeptidase domain